MKWGITFRPCWVSARRFAPPGRTNPLRWSMPCRCVRNCRPIAWPASGAMPRTITANCSSRGIWKRRCRPPLPSVTTACNGAAAGKWCPTALPTALRPSGWSGSDAGSRVGIWVSAIRFRRVYKACMNDMLAQFWRGAPDWVKRAQCALWVVILRRGRLCHFSVHHILAQSGPGQQEAQGAGSVQASHYDHGGLQALCVDLSTDVLQVLGQFTDYFGVTLTARQVASRNPELGDAGIEEDVGDCANEQRAETVAKQVDEKQHHGRSHCAHTHAHHALADRVLSGQIAVLHKAADDQADGSVEQIIGGEGEDIKGDRQCQAYRWYPGDGARMLLVHPGCQPTGGEGANGGGQGDRRVDPDRCLTGSNFVGADQKERLERGDTVTAERGNGGAGGHQPESRLAHQLVDSLAQAGSLLFRGFRRIGVATRRLFDCEFENKGDQQARQTDDKEGGAPVERVGNPAADDVGEHGAERNAHGVEAQGLGAFTRNEIVRDQGVGWRHATGLANTHTDAAHQQDPERAYGDRA